MSVAISNVSKSFGDVVVLNEICLDVRPGEFHTLLGPSGCGKTTLLRLIAGFEPLSAGQILLDGLDIASLPPRRRSVNTVFQSYALFPHMSAAENISFGLKMLKWSPELVAYRVQEMLELVELKKFAKHRPAELSGGQQQRVALARALAPEPRVLLLDEPLSALDFQLRKSMQSELKRLHAETKVTFILVTHDREEALGLSTRISVMDKGTIAQTGTPEEIYLRPANRFVATFVSNSNLFPNATKQGQTVAVRPERLQIKAAGCGKHDAVVLDADFVGEDTILTLKTSSLTTICARVKGPNLFKASNVVSIDWHDDDAVTVIE